MHSRQQWHAASTCHATRGRGRGGTAPAPAPARQTFLSVAAAAAVAVVALCQQQLGARPARARARQGRGAGRVRGGAVQGRAGERPHLQEEREEQRPARHDDAADRRRTGPRVFVAGMPCGPTPPVAHRLAQPSARPPPRDCREGRGAILLAMCALRARRTPCPCHTSCTHASGHGTAWAPWQHMVVGWCT